MMTVLAMGFATKASLTAIILLVLLFAGVGVAINKWWHKVQQGKAIIRNGVGGTQVAFSGQFVFPIMHQREIMDISVKRVEIYRHGEEGLVCKDNLRADIKVAFFVRVNKTREDVMAVAQLLGCERASDPGALIEFFDAKFSEALKTVGKRFDFVELYEGREKFKDEILAIIGRDLNGYVLDDAAIDYLEQTPLEKMNPNNILDAEGIKKITDLTAREAILSNSIAREKEKAITQQNVEAEEAILELNKQLAEAQEKQKREISEIQSRENAQAKVVQEGERLRGEQARIAAEEEIHVAEENKLRQVIVAAKNKERTEAIETERVEKDRLLEVTERERVVTLADIEKEKFVETERRNIQEVIRERVNLERTVVEEQEKIKDTEAFAGADRSKQVAVVAAEQEAESALVREIKAAEAAEQAATHLGQQVVIEADAKFKAAERDADSKKVLAEAQAAEDAAKGMALVQVMDAEAAALKKHGMAEAEVADQKYKVEAMGIEAKAEAMKKLDGVGKDHEEFKLRLDRDLQVDLKEIDISKDIAAENAKIVGEALKSANIDIVGGDGKFFDQIVNAVTAGKKVDRFVEQSDVMGDVKDALLNGNGDIGVELQRLIGQFGLGSADVANLSVSALIMKLMGDAEGDDKNLLQGLLGAAKKYGVGDSPAKTILGMN